ncbi:uncharacterized protein LOC143452875 [Clavelina lepadiformis]|uniref:uncharacterized protein LOC143452875 n=1 Tax=Clavelina lepadiformis TaxID=159417 RepID=UPI004042F019
MVLPPTLPNPTNNVVDELKKDRDLNVGITKSDLTNCPIVKTKEGTVTVNYHESPPSPNSENKKYESEKVQMIFIEKGKLVEVTVKFSDGTTKSRQIGYQDVEVTSTYTIEARADQAVIIATVFADGIRHTLTLTPKTNTCVTFLGEDQSFEVKYGGNHNYKVTKDFSLVEFQYEGSTVKVSGCSSPKPFGDVVERTDIPLEDILFSKGFLAKDALIYAKMLGIEGSFTVG